MILQLSEDKLDNVDKLTDIIYFYLDNLSR